MPRNRENGFENPKPPGATPTPARLSTPRVAGAVERTRLFTRLDQMRREAAVVWICSPPGAGKTTLVASYLEARRLDHLWYRLDVRDADPATFFHYLRLAAQRAAPRKRETLPLLTPEYRQGLPAFARTFFEEVGRRFEAPVVLVLDDYQDVPDESALHALLADALPALPGSFCLLVVSRNEPPPAFARLRLDDRIAFLRWEDVRFTRADLAALLGARGSREYGDAEIDGLLHRTQGWVGGATLMLEWAHAPAGAPGLHEDAGRESIFSYFAGELLQRAEPALQTFLLETALLPQVSVAAARALTGDPAADARLAQLLRRNFFITLHAGEQTFYQYHPLFREFLLDWQRDRCTPGELRALRVRAAALLEAEGRVEDAAVLLRDAAEWDPLAALVTRHAPALLAQGRSHLLESWLACLPPAVRDGSAPLLYWLGQCRLPVAPSEARVVLEQAYRLYAAAGDRDGICLAWSAVIDTFVHEWADMRPLDAWIGEMEGFLRRSPGYPSTDAETRVACGMFLALTYRQPQHGELPAWARRAERLVARGRDPRQRVYVCSHLLLYYTWLAGDLAKAGSIVDDLQNRSLLPGTPALVSTTWHMTSAAYYWMTADNDRAVATADAGLREIEASGVRAMEVMTTNQAVFAMLSAGDLAGAKVRLDDVARVMDPARLLDNAVYHHLRAWYFLARGELAPAAEDARLSGEYGELAGSPFFTAHVDNTLGLVLSRQGRSGEGLQLVRRARVLGQAQQSTTVEYLTWLIEAEILLDGPEPASCLLPLREALAVARRQGFQNHTWWRAPAMARLYAKALEAGIETDYVRAVVRTRRLVPAADGETPEAWPYPVKLCTLGRFTLLCDDRPIHADAGRPRKALDLLKALVAFGGRDVPEDTLAEALWPDSDGARARQNLKATLHRLRKLIDPDAVTLRGGRLSLDARRCWVDAWAFRHLTKKAIDEADGAAAARALALYQGPFLDMEAQGFALAEQERLRNRMLRLVERFADEALARHDPAAARAWYEKGIEADPLAERFYQGLMRVYAHLRRGADALTVYERCRRALGAGLGVEPSPETEALRRTLIASPPLRRP